jgi:hypothetical protein
MIEHYCFFCEDEYEVDPKSVVIREAPDFKGPLPVLARRRAPPKTKR